MTDRWQVRTMGLDSAGRFPKIELTLKMIVPAGGTPALLFCQALLKLADLLPQLLQGLVHLR
jgi:hypothetical protein